MKDSNDNGICVLCGDREDWIHILLNCCATETWEENGREWGTIVSNLGT